MLEVGLGWLVTGARTLPNVLDGGPLFQERRVVFAVLRCMLLRVEGRVPAQGGVPRDRRCASALQGDLQKREAFNGEAGSSTTEFGGVSAL